MNLLKMEKNLFLRRSLSEFIFITNSIRCIRSLMFHSSNKSIQRVIKVRIVRNCASLPRNVQTGNNMNLSFPVFNAAKGTRPNEALINKHDTRPDLKWNKTRNKLPRTSQRMLTQEKKRRNSYKIRLRVLPTPTGKCVMLFNMYATPSKPISNTLQSRFKCLWGTTAVSILLFFIFYRSRTGSNFMSLAFIRLHCIVASFHVRQTTGTGKYGKRFSAIDGIQNTANRNSPGEYVSICQLEILFSAKKMPTATTFVCTLQATRPQCIVNYMYNGRPSILNGDVNVHCIALHQAKRNECKLIQSATTQKMRRENCKRNW